MARAAALTGSAPSDFTSTISVTVPALSEKASCVRALPSSPGGTRISFTLCDVRSNSDTVMPPPSSASPIAAATAEQQQVVFWRILSRALYPQRDGRDVGLGTVL